MKALIRDIYSSDVDVESYRSADRYDDGQWIRLLIGPDGEPGEESFDVLVCTPRWLARRLNQGGFQFVRHTLLMEAFDLSTAIDLLRHEVASVTGSTWAELLLDLVQIGRWEFQNYRR